MQHPSCNPRASRHQQSPRHNGIHLEPPQDFSPTSAKMMSGRERHHSSEPDKSPGELKWLFLLPVCWAVDQLPAQPQAAPRKNRPGCTLVHHSCPKSWSLAPPKQAKKSVASSLGLFFCPWQPAALSNCLLHLNRVPAPCKSHHLPFNRISFIMSLVHQPTPIQPSLSLCASI